MSDKPNLEEIEYELVVSPRGLIESHGKLEEHAGRLAALAKAPESFRPLYGSYRRVSSEAVRRNQAQIRSGFLDYLYAVEPRIKETAK